MVTTPVRYLLIVLLKWHRRPDGIDGCDSSLRENNVAKLRDIVKVGKKIKI